MFAVLLSMMSPNTCNILPFAPAIRMSKMCFKKCVVKMTGESDLNVGEMTCVDRCVSKYMEAQDKVGTHYWQTGCHNVARSMTFHER